MKVFESISDALYSFIYDFSTNRESGDPKVIHDHIIFLLSIYKKLKSLKSFSLLLSENSVMIERQFQQCLLRYNDLIENAIKKKSLG